MTEKDYKELNEYLNEMFIYLNEEYKYILDNMLQIFIINDEFIKRIKEYDLNCDFNENNLTYQDVYDYARKIIESINKDYLPFYDKLIETGQLDFSYNSEYFDSHFSYRKGGEIKLININREFNYNDVVTLIHEFFHYTNLYNGKNEKNDTLTEFISIYFETYAINYLLKEGVSKEELGYYDRIISIVRRAKNLYYAETPLLAYNKFGDLSDDSIDLLKQFYTSNLNKEQFHKECKYLLDNLRRIKKEYIEDCFSYEIDEFELQEEYAKEIENHFKYFFGTLWSFYAIENCDIKDILYVNDHMYDDNLKIEDCFKKLKIDERSNETYNKSFESMIKYIEKNNTKRK